jgi:16S rRNA (uracil1498-N3)-methyltransferase
MPARLHIDPALAGPAWTPGALLALPANASRHVQVLRLQPGAEITLFDGRGGEWRAEVLEMGRKTVGVRLLDHAAVERELAGKLTLALGMPANERMDALIEKATELGAAAIIPLVCARSVLRLQGERAQKRLAHWQGVVVAACEQSGRTRLPALASVTMLPAWLESLAPPGAGARWLLSLGDAPTLAQAMRPPLGRSEPVIVLSGPEGGLSPGEEALARRCGFAAVSLGPRVMRADTAPLVVLACIAQMSAARANWFSPN